MQGWGGEASMLCAPWGLPLGSLSCTEEILRHRWVQGGSSEITGGGMLHQKLINARCIRGEHQKSFFKSVQASSVVLIWTGIPAWLFQHFFLKHHVLS